MIRVEHDEDARQRAFLDTPIGEENSGRVRYAAAMHFFQRGMLSRQALEVYRVCAKLDHEDPRGSLDRLGLMAELTDGEMAAAAIRNLLGEIERYLSGLPGPGVADVRAFVARCAGGFIRPRRAAPNPVVETWLEPALAGVRAAGQGAFADAIAAAAPFLRWITYDGYDRDAIGATFADGHAYCSIIGEDAAMPGEDVDLGLFLIAPHVFYRDHRHAAPELYAPLTGPHGWRFAPGDRLEWLEAGTPVWNEPFRPHATKVGAVPFLCVFGWTRDVNEVAKTMPADDWAGIEAARGPSG